MALVWGMLDVLKNISQAHEVASIILNHLEQDEENDLDMHWEEIFD